MSFRDVSTYFVKPVAAIAVILLPVALPLGGLGLLLGFPLVIVGLVLASPGIAALHALERPFLRFHLALGAFVGAAVALWYASIVVESGTDPHDVASLNLRLAGMAACLGAGFGAWSGAIWWAFFGARAGGGSASPLKSGEPSSPQCSVSAAIE